jgi:hypothetical protein
LDDYNKKVKAFLTLQNNNTDTVYKAELKNKKYTKSTEQRKMDASYIIEYKYHEPATLSPAEQFHLHDVKTIMPPANNCGKLCESCAASTNEQAVELMKQKGINSNQDEEKKNKKIYTIIKKTG